MSKQEFRPWKAMEASSFNSHLGGGGRLLQTLFSHLKRSIKKINKWLIEVCRGFELQATLFTQLLWVTSTLRLVGRVGKLKPGAILQGIYFFLFAAILSGLVFMSHRNITDNLY